MLREMASRITHHATVEMSALHVAAIQSYGKIFAPGGMTERLKVTVLKTVVAQVTVGSNPTPSARSCKLKSSQVDRLNRNF